jgi:hypothetical protein
MLWRNQAKDYAGYTTNMPGGLLQLVGTGAQNELVNGNPSMTHFRSVYRRHTNFAMEQIRLVMTASNLEFNVNSTRTFSCKVERIANLLHDCYLVLNIPDIWSPMKFTNSATMPTGYDARSNSMGYEFQWIRNLGYNLIDSVEVTMNGQVIQRMTGEWMKMYSYLTHDANKRKIIDRMIGNVPEVYDPANAYDRVNQYPHAIAVSTLPTAAPQTRIPEPSIRGRQLIVPLHFWFCENPGLALPLTSLQNTDVYINVTVRGLNDLYTVIDTTPNLANLVVTAGVSTSDGSSSTGRIVTYTAVGSSQMVVGQRVTITGMSPSIYNASNVEVVSVSSTTFTVALEITAGSTSGQSGSVTGPSNPTFGQRVAPVNYPLQLFLSPPLTTGLPSNTSLTTWIPDFYVEANYIYLTEMEMNQLARADQTFLVKTIKYVNKEGQFGGNTDLEIPMFNLVTRIVFTSQRSDRRLVNDWDNYTNWTNPNRAPWSSISADVDTVLYSSGQQQVSSVAPRDSIIDGVLLFDGKERFNPLPLPFFSLQQMYKYATGQITELPGVYQYSFSLDHDQYQPSGAANGSMFNKIILRVTLQTPLPLSVNTNGASTSSIVCVLTSTLFSPNPTVIAAADVNLTDPVTGRPLYPPGTITTVVQTNNNVIFTFTYNVGVYVEAMNFLRIVSGLGNLVFAS